MQIPLVLLTVSLVFAMLTGCANASPTEDARGTRVTNSDELREAAAEATPGTHILLASGEYAGGIYLSDLKGRPDAPIVIMGEDPAHPPVIEGDGECLHLSDIAHVVLRDLVLRDARTNGLNIDDGGSYETPSHHILLEGLLVQDVGPEGNRDGIKLSGVDEFEVRGCTVERWGSGGSGIDMVGCHEGLIIDSTFRHGDATGSNSLQMKGGTRAIQVRECRFEHGGQRAVNIGGSTGLPFFRPHPHRGYEARDITVERCVFIGSNAAVAFVGVDGAVVRFNTVYRPQRWVLRILQETQGPAFVPSRDGVFAHNLIAFRSDELATAVNIGPRTAPETFTFQHNFWYCLDQPDRSQPRLPTSESDGIYGRDPRFLDPESGDLRVPEGSPAAEFGAHAPPYGSPAENPLEH